MNDLLCGDCAQVLPRLHANTHDSMIIDPPSSTGFMGQAWDGDRGGRRQWVSWLSQVMREALRVLKPGAHGLVWAIPRRSHWTGVALEEAGFEIRDCIHHYFLNGFPKNMSVDKAIDKHLGAERPVVQTRRIRNIKGKNGYDPSGEVRMFDYAYTSPGSPEAKQWEGWGTHLKPAIEHWWLVRKPWSEKNVAANVLKWGTGALNIGASRIPLYDGGKTPVPEGDATMPGYFQGGVGKPRPTDPHTDFRYPSHFIVSDWELLGEHSGFFHPPIYCPKANAKERNRGCEGLPLITSEEITGRKKGSAGQNHPRACIQGGVRFNHHPTVKPVELMKYFARLLTPPGGHVLDCFMGSGSTGVACQQLGLSFTGIELDPRYIEIAWRRLTA